MASNICRCTGYQSILEAVRAAAGAEPRPMTAVGRSVRRVEDAAAPARRRALRRRRRPPGPALDARRPRRRRRTRDCSARSTPAAARARARRARRRHRRRPRPAAAHPRPARPVRPAARRLPPARARATSASATSASRSPPSSPRTPTSPRTRPSSSVGVRALESCSTRPPPWSGRAALHDGRRRGDALERGYGDVDAAFARAAHVVDVEVDVGRHTAVPLETRGLVADYDAALDRLTIWGATKVPHFNRRRARRRCSAWRRRASRCAATDAGGGFGVRGELYPEDVLVPWLARRARRAR